MRFLMVVECLTSTLTVQRNLLADKRCAFCDDNFCAGVQIAGYVRCCIPLTYTGGGCNLKRPTSQNALPQIIPRVCWWVSRKAWEFKKNAYNAANRTSSCVNYLQEWNGDVDKGCCGPSVL